jgi:hypothetical protein
MIYWIKLCDFVWRGFSKGDNIMEQGELVVVGQDFVEIKLGHHHPDKVVVKFIDQQTVVPCNPHHHDELKEKIKEVKGTYYLIISWSVTGVRTIEWKVFY